MREGLEAPARRGSVFLSKSETKRVSKAEKNPHAEAVSAGSLKSHHGRKR